MTRRRDLLMPDDAPLNDCVVAAPMRLHIETSDRSAAYLPPEHVAALDTLTSATSRVPAP